MTPFSPGPAEPKRPHRWRWILAIVVAFTLVVGGLYGLHQWHAARNWHRMEDALDAFPVPQGARVVDREREGSMNCGWYPCQWPRASITLHSADSSDQQCAELEAAVHSWRGGEPERDPESQQSACAWAGKVGPLRYWASVTADGQQASMEVMVAPTVGDEQW
jgi:hypothetical protein